MRANSWGRALAAPFRGCFGHRRVRDHRAGGSCRRRRAASAVAARSRCTVGGRGAFCAGFDRRGVGGERRYCSGGRSDGPSRVSGSSRVAKRVSSSRWANARPRPSCVSSRKGPCSRLLSRRSRSSMEATPTRRGGSPRSSSQKPVPRAKQCAFQRRTRSHLRG